MSRQFSSVTLKGTYPKPITDTLPNVQMPPDRQLRPDLQLVYLVRVGAKTNFHGIDLAADDSAQTGTIKLVQEVCGFSNCTC